MSSGFFCLTEPSALAQPPFSSALSLPDRLLLFTKSIMAFSRFKLRCRTAAIILLFLFGICSAAFSQGKPEKERIRIGYAARAVVHSIPYVTNAAGYFPRGGSSG